MRTRSISAVLAVAAMGLVVLAVAAAASPPDLHNGGDLHEGIGQGDQKDIQKGVTYRASAFPLSMLLRPPDDRWGGVQFESGRFRFIQLHHLRVGSAPLHGSGYITLEAATGPTASVAKTIARLRATPKIHAGPLKPASVAGWVGKSFDATIVGSDRAKPLGISLAPFTTNRHCGYCTKTMHGETQDVKFAGKGQLFRIIVVAIQGKTVVIYVESTFADQPRLPPAKTFPTFLPYAKQMLSALIFPG